MSIQEFLLARVAQDENDANSGTHPSYESTPNDVFKPTIFDDRRAAIYRHHDRSMTVTSIGEFDTITRCGVCPNESTRPCTRLKTLAQPDRDHPDYDVAWDLKPRLAT